MVPAWGLFPLVGLATAATMIASQAVITGVYSITHQSIQLGYSPLRNRGTAADHFRLPPNRVVELGTQVAS
jgi:K+ transporter